MKKNSYTVVLDGRPVVGPEGRLHGYSTLSGAKKAMREIASRWKSKDPKKRNVFPYSPEEFYLDRDVTKSGKSMILTIGVDIEELSPEPK